jgi:DNA-binding response OmpR family regulator
MALAKGPKMTSKWSILIVDDEFAVRESLRMLLKSYYKIFAAPNGEEALKILKDRKIDLITLDLNMPKLSGIDTLREIRKIDEKVPVIIVTGYGTQKDEKEALLYGVRDFISKPFNIKEIVSVIDGMLEERIEQERGAFKKKTRKV